MIQVIMKELRVGVRVEVMVMKEYLQLRMNKLISKIQLMIKYLTQIINLPPYMMSHLPFKMIPKTIMMKSSSNPNSCHTNPNKQISKITNNKTKSNSDHININHKIKQKHREKFFLMNVFKLKRKHMLPLRHILICIKSFMSVFIYRAKKSLELKCKMIISNLH